MNMLLMFIILIIVLLIMFSSYSFATSYLLKDKIVYFIYIILCTISLIFTILKEYN